LARIGVISEEWFGPAEAQDEAGAVTRQAKQ
jgi:hypothetical protein